MSEKLPDVWASRDFPVLVAVTRRMDAGAISVRISDLEADTGLPNEDVQNAARALERRGFLETQGAMSGVVLRVRRLSGEAYLITGLHPDGESLGDELIALLRQAADQSSDEDDRSALKSSARSLSNIPSAVLASVLTAWITYQTGIG